jgi:hypothetical protein
MVLTITGDLVECLRNLVAKGAEALKRVDKDGLPAEVIPSLLLKA